MNSSVPANQVLGSLGLGPVPEGLSAESSVSLPVFRSGLALWNVPAAQWLQRATQTQREAGRSHSWLLGIVRTCRRREKLVGGPGELEYAFFFQPAKAGRIRVRALYTLYT